MCAVIIIIFISLFLLNSIYLNWDYNDPENTVLGVAFHSFEWLFVRIAPIILIVLSIRHCTNTKESIEWFVTRITISELNSILNRIIDTKIIEN